MKLTALIDLGDDPVCDTGCGKTAEYLYDLDTGIHEFMIWGCRGPEYFRGSAGEMINAVASYRNNEAIRSLVAWLAK